MILKMFEIGELLQISSVAQYVTAWDHECLCSKGVLTKGEYVVCTNSNGERNQFGEMFVEVISRFGCCKIFSVYLK